MKRSSASSSSSGKAQDSSRPAPRRSARLQHVQQSSLEQATAAAPPASHSMSLSTDADRRHALSDISDNLTRGQQPSSTRKRTKSGSNVGSRRRSKKARKQKSSSLDDDGNSTDLEEKHVQISAASKVTPSSARLASVSRQELAEPQLLPIDLHRQDVGAASSAPNSPWTSSSSSSSGASSTHKLVMLAEGVVDLYPASCDGRTVTCRCGREDCLDSILTEAHLQAYGREYYEGLRSSEKFTYSNSSLSQPASVEGIHQHSRPMPTCHMMDSSNWTPRRRSPFEYSSLNPPPVLGARDGQDEDRLDQVWHHSDVTPRMRAILIDWLIELSEEYNVQPLTLQLAVKLMDKTMADESFSVTREMLQCLGCACMWTAAKLEEVEPPTIQDFVYISDNSYTAIQIADMEMTVCTILKFRMSLVTPFHFLDEFLRASYATTPNVPCYGESPLRHMALYLLEIALLPYELADTAPSLVAAAAVYLGRATLGQSSGPSEAAMGSATGFWTKTLEHYTGYDLFQLEDTVLTLHRYQREAEESKLRSVYTKYETEKYRNIALKTVRWEDELGF